MPRRLSIFTFIDALGWRILQRHKDAFLADRLRIRQPLGTVFGYSSTCDPTIISGRLPPEHGHFSFFAYDPVRSPFRWLTPLGLLPRALMDRGRVRHHLSKWVGRLLGYTGYFQLYTMPFDKLPLFDYTEKRDIYQPGGLNGGVDTIFDVLRARGRPFYLSDWRRSETDNLAALRAAIGVGQIDFAYLYLAHLDGVLHRDGTQAESVAEKIAWYDHQLRDLLSLAETRYDEVHLHLFSDHGMTDVHRLLPLISHVEELGLDYGQDYVAVYDSTMARFWFLRPGVRQRIRDKLDSVAGGRVLTDDDLERFHVSFPDQYYGELFYLLDPGVLLCPSFLGVTPLKGMHGYDPEDPDSVAFFGSTEQIAQPPRGLADLYGLMYAAVA